jgi:hypothetical protein
MKNIENSDWPKEGKPEVDMPNCGYAKCSKLGCVANFLVSSRAFDNAQVRPEVW